MSSRLQKSIEDVKKISQRTRQEAEVCHQQSTKLIEDIVKQAVGPRQPAETLQHLLESNPNYSSITGERRFIRSKPEVQVSEENTKNMTSVAKTLGGPTRKKVLRVLEFDVDAPVQDIEECQSLQYTLNARAKIEAAYIIQSKQVKRWFIKSEKSRRLLVNGNRPNKAMERISAVTLVSAEMISLFSLSKLAVVISYFCGLNPDFEINGEDWVHEMMKSLIGQLVQQLPADKMLFCIIDSISRFEAWPLAEFDFVKVLRKLTQIVERRKNDTMKLLLTCPRKSLNVGDVESGQEVLVGDVLVVPDVVDSAMSNVWNMNIVEGAVGAFNGQS